MILLQMMFWKLLLNKDKVKDKDRSLFTLFARGYFLFVSAKWIFTRISDILFPAQLCSEEEEEKETLSAAEIYIQAAKCRFLDTYCCDAGEEKYNKNVDSAFYVRKIYQEVIEVEGNELESEWNRRILIESIPQYGSIIMHFDAYKRGFAYYADQSIPYSILNAVAMKYVVTYRCRDFFLDGLIVPYARVSPFVKIYEQDDLLDRQKASVARSADGGLSAIDVQKGPFARLKSYSTATKAPSIVETDISTENALLQKYLIKNRFVCLGKICNFGMLRPVPTKQLQVSVSGGGNLDDVPLTSVGGPGQFSYRDFKMKTAKMGVVSSVPLSLTLPVEQDIEYEGVVEEDVAEPIVDADDDFLLISD